MFGSVAFAKSCEVAGEYLQFGFEISTKESYPSVGNARHMHHFSKDSNTYVGRYRRDDGTLGVGRYQKSLGKNTLVIQSANGADVLLERAGVFKMVSGEPRTDLFDVDWGVEFDPKRELTRKLLDGAGKLTSLSDFETLAPQEKIATLVKYLNAFVRWNRAAVTAENAGLHNFNEIVGAGAGVCRHLSLLLAALLSEAGLHPVLATYSEANDPGHAWLEVYGRDANGARQTWIADPSTNAVYVKPYRAALATAIGDRSSFEAKWLTNPLRTIILPTEN